MWITLKVAHSIIALPLLGSAFLWNSRKEERPDFTLSPLARVPQFYLSPPFQFIKIVALIGLKLCSINKYWATLILSESDILLLHYKTHANIFNFKIDIIAFLNCWVPLKGINRDQMIDIWHLFIFFNLGKKIKHVYVSWICYI